MRAFAQVPINFTLAPHSDEDTSRAAAKAITPHVERLERLVIGALKDCGPLAAHEIQAALGLSGDTVRPRLVTLRGKELVEESPGQYAVTSSGRSARVYRLTEKGKEVLR